MPKPPDWRRRFASAGPPVGFCPPPSFAALAVLAGAVRARPFLDAREVIVLAVMRCPHRVDERAIRHGFVVETLRERGALADAAELDHAVLERNVDAAADFGGDRSETGAAFLLPAREPARDAL